MNFEDRLGPNHLTLFLLHGVTDRQDYAIRNYTGKHIQDGEFDQLLENSPKKVKPFRWIKSLNIKQATPLSSSCFCHQF